MSTTDIKDTPVPLKFRILHVVRLIYSSIARLFFTFYYGNESLKIPSISDDILKEPATVVAKKIRNKEVSLYSKVKTFKRLWVHSYVVQDY